MDKYRNIGIEAVLKSGQFLLKNRDNVKKIKDKFGGADILTTADKKSEEIITSIIHKNFPSHAIFSEESGEIYGGSDLQWVMDPLDGTKHYIKGLPFFAVSLALRNQKGPVLAFTFIPITNELFISEKDRGVTFDGKNCKVSGEQSLANAIIYVEFPSSRFKVDWKKEDYDRAWRLYENLTRACFRTRAYGSGPIGMAYTAMGGFDAYVRFQPLSYEDVLGGSLMIKEAGGEITDQHGKGVEMKGNEPDTRLVASNGKIHEYILDILSQK
ncbi:hypothetical protein A2962_00030 [Candidatus Woesebacteria bacterium RIFCSPLOWO2_01_FULL_39_61]|uniref:Inositol-1-monophosphatase n=1 Tax=Candidatus Woesebacteria bacterium RIFCSPHIGHO2_02_FULL_39_13 TaxID=1802505 RepID=A0A1F7Z2I5_9BACT|nr:MAG: hypothetical protein A2692_02445 [Candidatus Woesebacteria bacterium RIFCSPHIGHO2_01_FULL_39_95]OGM33674.1 MAG: hypothetical protein A3D01_06010 [Candidatus Woesebacteria bacterium RIFCSPHIGHO2_02_FULL_39_13]OGM38910.1 MAG: hypothetical protein A3E13_02160 [Candidatus Woesebacteria bacterium RIFCSPHIGHO2_12_FULL_40_20]OGM68122.1 MAG: hypothetical protein A2962_00030 [Candidatus Woesebacteria bacterium RIFCSPLOWO2_01_FULL_39_61]